MKKKIKFEFNKPFLKFLPLFTIMLVLITLLSASYAILITNKYSKNSYVINVGTLEVTFVERDTNTLVIENAYPTGKDNTDKELVFRIKNTGNVDANYDIYIDTISDDDLDFPSYINYQVSKNNGLYSKTKLLKQDNYIDKLETLKVSDTVLYKVKAWLAEDTPSSYMNKTYKARVVINSNQG